MKISIQNQHRREGTVLMVTLFLAVLLGMFIFYYLSSVQDQRGLVARSQGWNGSLAMAEAGVEEALAQFNPGAPPPVIDRTANGWGPASAAGIYGPVARSLTDGSYSVVYTSDTFPIIYSTGYVTIPTLSATLRRVIRVSTTNAPFFSVALGARNGIDLKGNNINTDSFNSSQANLSTGGRYDPSKTSTNGDLASIAGIVNVGNANVNGSVSLGVTATDSIQNNGSVSGGVFQDFNVEFEDVILPQNSSSWPSAASSSLLVNGILYDYVFAASGNWSINNLSGSIYVASNAIVNLKLTGNATASNIEIAGTNGASGKLTIYMDGPSFKLSGNETADAGNAMNFSYYGTTNNTSISFSGNASLTGTIYAPEADVSMGGGGNNTYDVVGSVIGNTVSLNGHFNFHFDENLLAAGPTYYVANSWRELGPNGEL
jgi:hypothetical protein